MLQSLASLGLPDLSPRVFTGEGEEGGHRSQSWARSLMAEVALETQSWSGTRRPRAMARNGEIQVPGKQSFGGLVEGHLSD